MQDSSYTEFLSCIVEINQHAQAGRWHKAAELAQRLRPENLPRAQKADHAAIKAALANIADLDERASALRKDLSNLLKAFGPPLK